MSPVLDGIREAVTRQHGDRASVAGIAKCDPALLDAYASKQRVKVRNAIHGNVRTGIVSRTTGWAPVLLLVHRADAHGSIDILSGHDEVIGWWDGKRYSDQPCPVARSKHVRQ